MEKRLIDANAFKEYLRKGTEENADIIPKRLVDVVLDIMEGIMLDIDEQPTIDAVPKWIPCDERLPEQEEKAYLVYLDNGHVCDCKWWCRNLVSLEPTEHWRWDIFDMPQYARVLAWMPLPEPYVGERKDDE